LDYRIKGNPTEKLVRRVTETTWAHKEGERRMSKTVHDYIKVAFLTFVTTLLLLGGVQISPVWAAAPDGQENICTNAAVIFCDNFEARALGSSDLNHATYKSGWNQSEFSNETVVDSSSGGVYDGNHALQFRYPASTDGIGYMEIQFPGSYRELYFRWYQKWSTNFKFSAIATKGAETLVNGGATGQSMYFMWNNWGDGSISHFAQNTGGGREFSANVNGGDWKPTLGQWYCVEQHFKYNASGNDGIVEGWVDGVQRWNYPNVNLDNNGTVMIGMLLSGYWNNSTGSEGNPGGTSHPLMYRWHDNVVISTQRIGCLGATPPPTQQTSPAAPSGLRAM
jgi:hypothetical protein